MQSQINSYFIPKKRKVPSYAFKQPDEKIQKIDSPAKSVTLRSIFECFNIINPLINPKDMNMTVIPKSKVLQLFHLLIDYG